MTKKWIWIFGIIIVILLVVFIVLATQLKQFGQEAKLWLASRHSKNFIIDSVQFSIYHGKIAYIHPEDNPNINFTLYYSKESDLYIYNYYNKSLEYDTNQRFQKLLDGLYSDAFCSSAVYLSKYGKSDFIETSQGRPAVWDDVNGIKYIDWLWINIGHELSDEDYSKMFQIIQYGNQNNFDIHFVFYFKSTDNSQYSFRITTQQFSQLNSEQEFIKYINKRGEMLDF